ncbi:MAG: O-antigen ligase family protein [Spirosomataceae bacterium]
MINAATISERRGEFLWGVLVSFSIIIGMWRPQVTIPVWLLIILGESTRRWRQKLPFPSLTWIDVCFLLTVLVFILQDIFAIYRANTFYALQSIVTISLVYVVMRLTLTESMPQSLLLLMVAIIGVFMSSFAFLQFNLIQSRLLSDGWTNASQFKGLFGPFGLLNNEWATLCICFLPFPFISTLLFGRYKFAVWFGITATVLVTMGIWVTCSRGAYLSLGLFAALMVVFFIIFKTKRLLSGVVFGGVLLALLLSTMWTPFTTTLSLNKTFTQRRSTEGRLNILESGFCQAKEHWLNGVGSNNYGLINDLCRTPSEDMGYTPFTTTTYLQILLEHGVVGLILFGALFLSVVWGYYKAINSNVPRITKQLLALLLIGFLTFVFRELFFSTLFYSKPVMVIATMYVAFANQTNRFSFKPIGWICVCFGLVIVSGWMYIETSQRESAAEKVELALQKRKAKQLPQAIAYINKAIEQMPSEIPYHKLAGLLNGQTSQKVTDLLQGKQQKEGNIDLAIRHFQKVLELNPNDAGANFNLGWLSHLSNQPRSITLSYVDNALTFEPNNPEFLLGKGILLECLRDTLKAFETYTKALRLDPELFESPFWNDFQKRHPLQGTRLLRNVAQSLEQQQQSHYSTVVRARYGRVLIQQGQLEKAKQVLEQVNIEVPDLYRPYYYLALIHEHLNDSLAAKSLFTKALSLRNTDYLVAKSAGDFYYRQNPNEKSNSFAVIRNYQNAIKSWLAHPSYHHTRSNSKYKYNLSVLNDYVVQDLLRISYADLDITTLISRIAQMYQRLGRSKEAAYYQKLMLKKLEDIQEEDILYVNRLDSR